MTGKSNLAANDLYKEQPACWKIVLRYALSHVGLFFIIIGTMILATYIFIKIEGPNEMKEKMEKVEKANYLKDTRNYLAKLFWYYKDRNYTEEKWTRQVLKELMAYENFTIKLVNEYGYDGTNDPGPPSWNWPSTILFVFTIMTTIGYGNLFPRTDVGKISSILVTIVTVPILFLFLAMIGDSMAKTFIYIYSRLCCRCCRARRKISEISGKLGLKKWSRLEDENVGTEDYMPTSEVQVPITLTILLVSIYVILGALLFNYTEGWDFTTSAYFVWITLASIGLGDYIPGNTFDDVDSLRSILSIAVAMLYILLGLAWVSMAINLTQQQLTRKFRWMAKEIGLNETKEPYVSVQEYRRRAKSKPSPYEVSATKNSEITSQENLNKSFTKLGRKPSTSPEEPSAESVETKTSDLLLGPEPQFELPGTPLIHPKYQR